MLAVVKIHNSLVYDIDLTAQGVYFKLFFKMPYLNL